jgi:hypothetical protein
VALVEQEKVEFLHCGSCGGPHQFDTSVPSVIWNQVIRAQGLSEYLCTTCIVREFARAGRNFTAALYGAGFHGLPIEIQVDNAVAQDAHLIQEENNALRWKLFEAEATLARVMQERDAECQCGLAPEHHEQWTLSCPVRAHREEAVKQWQRRILDLEAALVRVTQELLEERANKE